MEQVICSRCNKNFSRKRSQILLAKEHYCSLACFNLSKKKGLIISCYACQKKVYKKNSNIDDSKSKKFFCSIKCSNKYLGLIRRGEKHPNWKNGASSYKKQLIRANLEPICRICKEINKKVLIAHHVDQNRKNNKINNLVWLCLNCHFLVHHHIEELLNFNKKIKIDGN